MPCEGRTVPIDRRSFKHQHYASTNPPSCHNLNVRLALVILGTCALLCAQDSDEDFHVYRDPPRIALTAQRLRLLERERERNSTRWQAFDALMSAEAPMPQPGFAWALYYRITKERSAARKAIDWALQHDDLRQLALVYDWCLPVTTPAESERLEKAIQQGLARPATTMETQAARALAAVALADKLPDAGNAALTDVARWWRAQTSFNREDLYPLFELLHAIRDNTKVDLRRSKSEYFTDLPINYVAAFYPAAHPGPDNDFRVPVSSATGDPDLDVATQARAAGLAMVAYDTNAENYQYAQGLLMNDRFAMRGPLGAPYEFLWANPYQPGLAYQTLPLVYHDPASGEVFARTTWDEDATWLGYFGDSLQMFRDGGIQTLRKGAAIAPVHVGPAVVMGAADPESAKAKMDSPMLFVLGLAPKTEYAVEIDDQELDYAETDVGGTLVIRVAEETDAGVRIHRHAVNPVAQPPAVK